MTKRYYTMPEAAEELKIQRDTLLRVVQNLHVRVYNEGVYGAKNKLGIEGMKKIRAFLSQGIFIPMRVNKV